MADYTSSNTGAAIDGAVDYVELLDNIVTVDSGNNRIGINNGSPASALDVTGTVTADGLTVDTDTLVVDATNNRVGIGTSSIEGRLHVYNGASGKSYAVDGADQLILENNSSVLMDIRTPADATGGILFSDANARGRGVIQYSHSTDAMYFNTAGASAMTIDAGGNLGIGTSSPSANITIDKGLGGSSPTTFTTANSYLQLGVSDYNSSGGVYAIGFGYSGGATHSPAYIGLQQTETGSYTKGDLVFRTRSTSTDVEPLERMRIDSAGTTTFTKSGGGNIRIAETASRYTEIFGYAEGTADGSTMTFHTIQSGTSTSTERMRIDADGNLLVGTTDSSGDTANSKPVVAGRFTTKNGVTSGGTSGSTVTLMTFGSNEGNFLVSARASGTGAITDNTTGIIHINNSASSYTALAAGSKVVLSMSGLALQVTQTVFTGANISWNVVKIS